MNPTPVAMNDQVEQSDVANELRLKESQETELPADQLALRTAAEASLRKWNIAMTALHGFQALAVLGAGLAVGNLKSFKTPLATTFPSWSSGFPQPAIQQIGSLPFVPVTSIFAFLSAIFHGLVLIGWNKYIADLRKGINRFRWYEYALSSSLMIGLIAQLFGIYDVNTLILIMSINACMNLFGLSMEEINQYTSGKIDWSNFWFGCFAGIVPWAVVIAQAAGTPGVKNAPKFVWAVVAVYFIGFLT